MGQSYWENTKGVKEEGIRIMSVCKGCICIPICRHKRYEVLLFQCSIVATEILGPSVNLNFWDKLREIMKDLGTTKWLIKKHSTGEYIINKGEFLSSLPILFTTLENIP